MPEQTLDRILGYADAGAVAIDVPDGPRLTYADLREQVDRAADALAQLGLGRGDRIALVLPNSAETIVLFLAAARVGTAAPLNPAYKEDEFRFYLDDIQAKALVVPPGGAEAARKAMPAGAALAEARVDQGGKVTVESDARRDATRTAAAPGDDDVALVLHTSGTTSRPKQVPLLRSVSRDHATAGIELRRAGARGLRHDRSLPPDGLEPAAAGRPPAGHGGPRHRHSDRDHGRRRPVGTGR